jgi:hypothetical protein
LNPLKNIIASNIKQTAAAAEEEEILLLLPPHL